LHLEIMKAIYTLFQVCDANKFLTLVQDGREVTLPLLTMSICISMWYNILHCGTWRWCVATVSVFVSVCCLPWFAVHVTLHAHTDSHGKLGRGESDFLATFYVM
jgi:hypothetical protein